MMTEPQILELPRETRLMSIYDSSDNVYMFQYNKSVNNILCAFVQKFTESGIEMLKFPLNYFLNEFLIYVEPVEEELVEISLDKVVLKK